MVIKSSVLRCAWTDEQCAGCPCGPASVHRKISMLPSNNELVRRLADSQRTIPESTQEQCHKEQ